MYLEHVACRLPSAKTGGPFTTGIPLWLSEPRDKLKLLIWHLNGYWLLYNRLEKQRFQWPDWFTGDMLILEEQLQQLRKTSLWPALREAEQGRPVPAVQCGRG